MNQETRNWMSENRRNINQRLTWIRAKENGLLLHNTDNEEEIIITKNEDFVCLHFVEKNIETNEDEISDVMSFIDVRNPLLLQSQYAQAMLLSLLFVPTPKRLYMLGFGGGRLPLVLHHHIPELYIESSELSKGVISTLEMCFGVKTDDRLKVDVINGREHLQSFKDSCFDIILLDSFSGAGKHPNELSSLEFYNLCCVKMSDKAVVATNLVDNNPLFKQKVATFSASFKYTYSYKFEVNHVLLGSNSLDFTQNQLVSRALEVDRLYSFGFKLKDIAENTRKQECTSGINLLCDESAP